MYRYNFLKCPKQKKISGVRFDTVNVVNISERSVDMTIKIKHSQNCCFKNNFTLKKRVRNVGLCNMSLEMRRNTAYVYEPIIANITMSTIAFSSVVQQDASGREARLE